MALATCVASACASPTSAPADAAHLGLTCAVPMSIPLATSPSTGVPTAGIAWRALDHCVPTSDERDPELIFAVIDGGPSFGNLVIVPATDWAITASSLSGGGPAGYLADAPRDTDITLELHGPVRDVGATVRIEASTLVLVALALR